MNDKKELETLIINKTREVIDRANILFVDNRINFDRISFNFKLKGTTAGTADAGKMVLSFNLILAQDNLETFFNDTIPHEVAHLFQRQKYPRSKPHGNEWKYVFSKMGYTPERCHRMDTKKIREEREKNLNTYLYRCNCREFHINTALHNKMKGGQRRFCRKCKGQLFLADEFDL